MLKKCSYLLVVMMMVMTINAPKAEAIFGVGDIVFDPTNAKNTFFTQLNTLATQANTLLMQKQAYENYIINLTRVADGILDFNINQIGMSLAELAVVTHPANDPHLGDVSLEYNRLQREWDAVYNIEQIIKADNPKSAHDYALKLRQLMEYTRVYTRNAKTAQGHIAQLDKKDGQRESVAKRLEDLMKIAKAAPGSLAAQQATQQIAALQAEQLIRMQYVMADSQHAQAAYQAQVALREEMELDTIERYYTREIVNYTMQDMKGSLAGLESLD